MLRFKVFLVDDHPVYLEGLKNIIQKNSSLELLGAAVDGMDALQFLETGRPDLSLIDISLPRMNGIELIKRIRANNHKTKVIVLSQMADEKTIREIIQLNVNGYILKTEGIDEITNAIEAVMKGQTYFSYEISQKLYQFNQGPHDKKQLSKDLSDREKEVVVLISKGKSVRDIASDLGCSENTIKSHKSNIMRKIDVSNSAGISAWAYKSGLVES